MLYESYSKCSNCFLTKTILGNEIDCYCDVNLPGEWVPRWLEFKQGIDASCGRAPQLFVVVEPNHS